jgi:signal transduction histidine kinase
MNVEDCHRPEDWKSLITEFEALARGDRKIAPAVPFRTKDGKVVYADVGGTVINIEGRDCLVGFLRDLTDARRAEETLKKAHMKLMTARDEERKYIAAELHDSVSQKLVALSMQLQNNAKIDSGSPSDTCSELILDIRAICHGLYPPALETLGLVSALTQLEKYGKSAGLVTAIRCDPRIAQARFAPEIEIALFRIAQEAVNNSVRHSRGTNMDIDLMYTDGQLVLAVIDDGQGFDVKTAEGTGLGLRSMRDRARAIAATLTIDSEPGETRIEVAAAVDLKETNEKKGL